MKFKILVAVLLVHCQVNAEPAMHTFELWGMAADKDQKLLLYSGWANGFLPAKGAAGLGLNKCLEGLPLDRITSAIDKQFNAASKNKTLPFHTQVLEALTGKGAPCAGKNPAP